MENKMKYYEQFKEHIYNLCEKNDFDINKEEFSIEYGIECMNGLTVGGIYYKNKYTVNNVFRLKEKNGRFSISVMGNADPMYVAYYAAKKYIERREEYLKKEEEKCKQERMAKKKYSLLDGLFNFFGY